MIIAARYIYLPIQIYYLINFYIFFVTAVREDRMPGGRNSGAVYNLYKVKYKKHKKANKTATATSRQSPPDKPKDPPLPPLPPHLVNGTILKTALTNPSEVSNQLFNSCNTYKINNDCSKYLFNLRSKQVF